MNHARQADAHVRARAALIRRVVNRWYDWRAPKIGRYDEKKSAAREERMLRAAAEAVSGYRWPDGWGNKYGAYSPFEGAPFLGQHVDVPASTLHPIMCEAMQHYEKSGS